MQPTGVDWWHLANRVVEALETIAAALSKEVSDDNNR